MVHYPSHLASFRLSRFFHRLSSPFPLFPKTQRLSSEFGNVCVQTVRCNTDVHDDYGVSQEGVAALPNRWAPPGLSTH